MRFARRTSLATLILALVAGTARAHELPGSRFDSPIPLTGLLVGAGAVVALTAVVSARRLGGSPRTTGPSMRVPAAVAAPARLVLRLVGLGLFAVLVVAGLLGPQVRAENLATVVTWPLWLDGLPLVAALVGSPWRFLSPWRTLYDGLTALEGEPVAVVGAYPERLDVWPALAGFAVLIGVVENLTAIPRSPLATSLLLSGLAVAMLLGGVAFGPTWFDRADPVAVFLRLFGRVAPIRVERRDDGAYDVSARAPWAGSARPVSSLATGWFVVTTVYTVSFDGFTATPEYQAVVFGLLDLAHLPIGLVGVPLYVVGLLAFVATFTLVVRLTAALADGSRARSPTTAFAPTVLPISVAYQFAHYYPYVGVNLALAVGLVREALGGGGAPTAPLAWLSLPAFWASQVVLIVLGHLVAVVAAHYVARERFGTARDAWIGHLPLVALMVGYTVLSLWIISRPVVAG